MRQTLKIKLFSLTPVVIGSGEKYPACQIVSMNSSHYRMREMAFFRMLHNYPQLRMTEAIMKVANQTIRDPQRVLSQEDLFYELKKYVDQISGEIISLIRHPSGDLYLPGSSIKGAIRKAIQYHIMKQNKDLFRQKVRDALKTASRKQDMAVVTNYVDSTLRLSSNEICTDFGRYISVTDSTLSKATTCLVKIGIFKIVNGTLKFDQRRQPFLIEVIPPSTEFETEISFDLEMLEKMQKELSKQYRNLPRSVEEILNCVREMYQDVLEDELKDLCNENTKYMELLKKIKSEPNKIHIGYGGGLKASSLFILLDQDLRIKVRNLIKPHGNDIAPLSRRCLLGQEPNKPYSPFGWFSFKVV
ncbi:type III-A CRISPR-associated RAMP protein Csm5 [Pseudothermotoga sp. U03pept]|uniref:type III-A CRISPR-associated RAMP protein Csm5 n=1 Tax=Pseudothermotoga sp. U03pept TaxID=3447012 RepID=UPI003F036C7A